MLEKTHIFIFNHAWNHFLRFKQNRIRNLKLRKDKIIQGIKDADTPSYKSLYHWYNPKLKKGIMGFKNAKEKGIEHFYHAIRLYKAKRYNQSSYYLGSSIHFLTDIGTPSHTQSNYHLFDSDDQENFIEANYSKIKIITPKRLNKRKIHDLFENLARISSRFKCGKNNFITAVKYKITGIKENKLHKKLLMRQSPKLIHHSTSHIMTMMDLFYKKVHNKHSIPKLIIINKN